MGEFHLPIVFNELLYFCLYSILYFYLPVFTSVGTLDFMAMCHSVLLWLCLSCFSFIKLSFTQLIYVQLVTENK